MTSAMAGREPRSVVHLTAEYWPLARTGGLGQAVAELAGFQASAGLPVTVVLPLYRAVREVHASLAPFGKPFRVTVGPREEEARLLRFADQEPLRVLFVDHPGSFDRAGIYGEGGADYPDSARRFALFCAAALEALPELGARGVVLHAHDWHAALAIVYQRTRLAGRSPRAGAVLTVHNAGFQGHYPHEALADLGLPPSLWSLERMEWYGKLNLLKGGLVFCDMATTVSPTHAIELRTQAGGFGLHETFLGLRDRLTGIRNGINMARWDPAADPLIPAHYTGRDLGGKAHCKAELQRELELPEAPRAPLFAMSARLVAQKGLDLLLGGATLRGAEAQFAFLGAGEARYEAALGALAAERPDRVAACFDFSDEREHRLLAGADFLLMPSQYEPCGLTQMRAQRYGTLPIARRVGGLADTIDDEVSGFLFDDYTPAALDRAVHRALALYADPVAWEAHARDAMCRDFGWEQPAARYLEVYRRALALR